MQLGMWSSVIIVTAFSFLVIFLDEYIVKPWRERHYEKLAESGDEEAKELIRLAKSAKVYEE